MAGSQVRTRPSSPPVAICRPSGRTATAVDRRRYLRAACATVGLRTGVPDLDQAVAAHRDQPRCRLAPARTPGRRPPDHARSEFGGRVPRGTSHTTIVPSSRPRASSRSSGLAASRRIGPRLVATVSRRGFGRGGPRGSHRRRPSPAAGLPPRRPSRRRHIDLVVEQVEDPAASGRRTVRPRRHNRPSRAFARPG